MDHDIIQIVSTTRNRKMTDASDGSIASKNELVAECDSSLRKLGNSLGETQQQQCIQDLKSRIDALEATNKKLMEESSALRLRSNRQLESFASMVHELRTPLNCIVGLTHLLLLDGSEHLEVDTESSKSSTNLCAEHRESVELIQSSCHLLRAVVDDVLDLSKLESATFHVNSQPVSVKKVIKNIVDMCSAHAKQTKEVSIRTNYVESESFVHVIQTDSRLLTQILFNLISNAVKFSHPGGVVEISVSFKISSDTIVEDSDTILNREPIEDRNFLCIYVKDHGKGIAQSHLQNIFQPFQQAGKGEGKDSCSPDGINHGHQGTGLGLTIANRMVRALGGTLNVASELGQWSEFVVMLPQEVTSAVLDDQYSQHSATSHERRKQRSAPLSSQSSGEQIDESVLTQSTTPASESVPDKNFENFKVLIAEDSVINQKVLQRSLQKLGIKDIDVVDDGSEAVEISSKKEYDVIFMDIQMPVMDGFEATMKIRSRSETAKESHMDRSLYF
jgi:signal transduction histidine kinase